MAAPRQNWRLIQFVCIVLVLAALCYGIYRVFDVAAGPSSSSITGSRPGRTSTFKPATQESGNRKPSKNSTPPAGNKKPSRPNTASAAPVTSSAKSGGRLQQASDTTEERLRSWRTPPTDNDANVYQDDATSEGDENSEYYEQEDSEDNGGAYDQDESDETVADEEDDRVPGKPLTAQDIIRASKRKTSIDQLESTKKSSKTSSSSASKDKVAKADKPTPKNQESGVEIDDSAPFEIEPAEPLELNDDFVLPSKRTVAENRIHNKGLCKSFLAAPFPRNSFQMWRDGFSQFGQDRYVSDMFGRKPDPEGVYVDVGAFDGETHSNSWLFEHCLGWSGIVVEPNKRPFELTRQWRPTAVHYNAAITSREGICPFNSNPMEELSGLVSTVKSGSNAGNVIKLKCARLETLLKQNEFTHVNYLSVDTEGNELEVLKSIDFDYTQFDVIGLEDNANSADIAALLKSKGYKFHEKLGEDNFFIHSSFRPKSS